MRGKKIRKITYRKALMYNKCDYDKTIFNGDDLKRIQLSNIVIKRRNQNDLFFR